MNPVPKLPDTAFTFENAVCHNGVFLLANCDTRPFMKAADGWEMVGWGRPPWPRNDSPVAIMFERIAPDEPYKWNSAELGTRLWQHGRPEWIPGHPEYVKEMSR